MPSPFSRVQSLASAGILSFCFCIASCDSGKEPESSGGKGGSVATPAEAKSGKATPALSSESLARVVRASVLVRAAGQPDCPGVLLAGSREKSSRNRYLVLCDVPAQLKSVQVGYHVAGKVQTSSAKRASTPDSGLSIFEFTTASEVEVVKPGEPVSGETQHAIRLVGEGTLPEEENAKLTAELESISLQRKETQKRWNEALRMRMERERDRSRMGMRPGAPDPMPETGKEEEHEIRGELSALTARESNLRGRLRMPVTSIKGVEAAAAQTRDELEANGISLDQSLLAGSTGIVRAVRHGGKWVDVTDVVSAASGRIEQVKLDVTGDKQSIRLACSLGTAPTDQASYSLVAATTAELESAGGGTLEDRLSRVEPVPFTTRNASLSASRNINWDGQRTRLWIRIFSDTGEKKPLVDEVVLLDYSESFSARWGKPPSPLVVIPNAQADTPADLVREREVLDAKGPIRDLVAAGDGSTLMVQTTEAPYWQQLDLKTGKWMSPPWTAKADTLLAAQAGKIYLLSKGTGILEIWDLASGKRDNLQLLALEGTILAMAAPLSDPERPVFVATDRNAWLLDPRTFEVAPTGLDLGRCFVESSDRNRGSRYPLLDSRTVWLRASADGTLYGLHGTMAREDRGRMTTIGVTLDRALVASTSSWQKNLLPSKGRFWAESFPDHGGSGGVLRISSRSNDFPGSPGQIDFRDDKTSAEKVVMRNPPLVPAAPDDSDDGLMPDRGIYFDSSLGVALFPDEERLHLVRLKLAAREPGVAEFLFPGEVMEFPLPPGSDHQLVTSLGGQTVIGESFIQWIVPDQPEWASDTLKMDWKGELGSRIRKKIPVRIMPQPRGPFVESADGTKRVPLRRRRMLANVSQGITSIAGSGQVLLTHDGSEVTAWNLSDGRKLLTLEKYPKKVFGDADRIYVQGQDNSVTCHDLRTGELLPTSDLGKEVEDIDTGMASRMPLLAVERENVQTYLMEVRREGLKPVIVELPEDKRQRFFIPELRTNAAGSATWSRDTAVFRDKGVITVKTFGHSISNGVPDASGRYIIGSTEILDTRSDPPKLIQASSLPGMGENAICELEESGRYLLLSTPEDGGRWLTTSVRDMNAPGKELFKLRRPSGWGDKAPTIVSDTRTLLHPIRQDSEYSTGIFDFDIPGILKELSIK